MRRVLAPTWANEEETIPIGLQCFDEMKLDFARASESI